MKNFIYPSRIKKSNLGDILINVLLIREISKYGYVYLDGNVNEMAKLLTMNNPNASNIHFVKKPLFFDGIPVFRWLRLLFLVPHVSFIFDPPGHYFEGKNKSKFILKSIKYFTRALVLRAFNIKVIRLGVTLGPFSDKGWRLQKLISTLYYNISVRDSKNFNELLNRNLHNVSYIDDLSFLFESQDFINHSKKAAEDSKYIVLSFRGGLEDKHLNKDYLEKVSARLIRFIQDNPEPNCTYVLSYQVQEDLEANRYISSQLKEYKIKHIVKEEQLNFLDAIELYFNAKYVITNRLHVALLALLNQAGALIITDLALHHKVVNVYRDLGLQSLLLDCKNETEQDSKLNYEQILAYVDSFDQKRINIKQNIETTMVAMI